MPQDFAQAFNWFGKAADQGNADAEVNLGIAYLNGNGVEQDSAEAAKWLSKSAGQGNALAQYARRAQESTFSCVRLPKQKHDAILGVARSSSPVPRWIERGGSSSAGSAGSRSSGGGSASDGSARGGNGGGNGNGNGRGMAEARQRPSIRLFPTKCRCA